MGNLEEWSNVMEEKMARFDDAVERLKSAVSNLDKKEETKAKHEQNIIYGHTFLFWHCYTRYVLLIIDKFPVEFSLLMPLLHLSLETAYRFIHLRYFFTILLSLSFLS